MAVKKLNVMVVNVKLDLSAQRKKTLEPVHSFATVSIEQ